jgi:hypothetical protein
MLCPSCPTTEVVRASVFGEYFWTNLASVALPLTILALVVAALHRIGRPRAHHRAHARKMAP